MGSVFGKIREERPKYQVLHKTPTYEIREYESSIVAEVTYDPKDMKDDPDGGFMILANYIGALGNPQNIKPEKIAMTAPVITRESAETIAMTSPVITRETRQPADSIAMTAPVITKGTSTEEGTKKLVTMQFVLPKSKYSMVDDAPKPIDPRVVIKEEGERKYGVVCFNGVALDNLVQENLGRLKVELERDGYKVTGQHLLARYNPPWILPPLRTNEILVPIA